jgi:hypothetical protein
MLVVPAGLRTDPAVEGAVTATFAIDRNAS